MKGNPKLLEVLNSLLADELSAISQYMVHSEMCDAWGYQKLHDAVEKRAMDEMKHAEKLIGRILFLEGHPMVSKLHPIKVGAEVPAQIANDLESESGAIVAYNEAIKLAGEVGDHATRDFLTKILLDEDRHLDELEMMRDQIQQLGVQLFLVSQLK